MKIMAKILKTTGGFLKDLLADSTSVSSKRMGGLSIVFYTLFIFYRLTNLVVANLMQPEAYKVGCHALEVFLAIGAALLGATAVKEVVQAVVNRVKR
jgi:hypothetical protein